jgi:hypothetical protein
MQSRKKTEAFQKGEKRSKKAGSVLSQPLRRQWFQRNMTRPFALPWKLERFWILWNALFPIPMVFKGAKR